MVSWWARRISRVRKNMLWQEATEYVRREQPKLDTIDTLCLIVHRYEELLDQRPEEIGADLLEKPR